VHALCDPQRQLAEAEARALSERLAAADARAAAAETRVAELQQQLAELSTAAGERASAMAIHVADLIRERDQERRRAEQAEETIRVMSMRYVPGNDMSPAEPEPEPEPECRDDVDAEPGIVSESRAVIPDMRSFLAQLGLQEYHSVCLTVSD
jgi:hypothetical protein